MVDLFSLQVELKVYSNELWNELHNYAQMYRNVLQTARVHWRVPVLFSLKSYDAQSLSKKLPLSQKEEYIGLFSS